MNKNDAWTFFENTGNLDAYLIYKQLENDKKPFDTKRDRELFLQGQPDVRGGIVAFCRSTASYCRRASTGAAQSC